MGGNRHGHRVTCGGGQGQPCRLVRGSAARTRGGGLTWWGYRDATVAPGLPWRHMGTLRGLRRSTRPLFECVRPILELRVGAEPEVTRVAPTQHRLHHTPHRFR